MGDFYALGAMEECHMRSREVHSIKSVARVLKIMFK